MPAKSLPFPPDDEATTSAPSFAQALRYLDDAIGEIRDVVEQEGDEMLAARMALLVRRLEPIRATIDQYAAEYGG